MHASNWHYPSHVLLARLLTARVKSYRNQQVPLLALQTATSLDTLPVPWLTWILSNHAVAQSTTLVSCRIFSARLPLFFTRLAVKHNIITSPSHWHDTRNNSIHHYAAQFWNKEQKKCRKQTIICYDKTRTFTIQLTSSWFYAAPRSFCFASIQ